MKNLENILSHTDCLSQEEMQSYLAQALDQEQTLQIENHLSDCMFCSDAVEGLQMVSPEESAQALDDIKSQIEGLLFTEKEEQKIAPIVEASPNPPKPLTVKKGGRKIGWAAAAGLFFLIFGAGLAVFSYINYNTNWLNQEKNVATTKGDAKDKLNDYNESKSNGRELESYSLSEEDLTQENEAAEADMKSRKETKKDFKLSENKRSNTASTEERLARSDAPLPNPTAPSKNLDYVKDRYAANENEKEQRNSSENIDFQKKATPAVVKAEKSDPYGTYGNLSKQNAYEIPRYEGKLKEINKAPAVTATDKANSKKINANRLKAEEMQDIEAVQSSGKYNKIEYQENTDSYTEGNKAYDKGDYKQSIKLYKRALRQKNLKNRSDVMYQLALAYEKTNNASKAEELFKELEKIGAYQSRARSGLNRVRSR